MKKTIFTLLAAASVMTMSAETVVWDFFTHGIFKDFNDPNSSSYVAKEADIIDKYGQDRDKNALMDATKDPESDDPYHNQHGYPNRVVSLFDARTYALTPDETWNNGTLDKPTKFVPGEEVLPGVFTDDELIELGAEYAANLKNNPYIGWLEKTPENKYFGPCRMHWYNFYGSTDAWVDANYNALDEANWVSDMGALVFIASGQGKKPLAGTFVQFPEVQGPCKVTYYIGSTTARHDFSIIPFVNDAAVDGKSVSIAEDVTAKRYYKREYNYDGNDKVSLRFLNDGCGLVIQRVEIETNAQSAIENIIANDADENAPVYNVMGVQVDENYKGVVIKNGKKYIQR